MTSPIRDTDFSSFGYSYMRMLSGAFKLPLLVLAVLACISSWFVHAQSPACSDSSLSTVVASVNGKRISLKDLDSSVGVALYRLQEQIYALRKQALDNLIMETLLADEAAKRNVSVPALIRVLVPETVSIPQSAIEKQYSDASTTLGLPKSQGLFKVELDLQSQARMNALKTAISAMRNNYNVLVYLEPPPTPTGGLSSSGPSRGSANAKVTLLLFSDFQCPYCKQMASIINKLSEHYGDALKIVYKHYPLNIHPNAFTASCAALCAEQQGQFWQYHDMLYRTADLSLLGLKKAASDLGLDMAAFNSCLDSQTTAKRILESIQEARSAGIESTPSVVINGKVLVGLRAVADYQAIIDNLIK